jgi:hypothetical protein
VLVGGSATVGQDGAGASGGAPDQSDSPAQGPPPPPGPPSPPQAEAGTADARAPARIVVLTLSKDMFLSKCDTSGPHEDEAWMVKLFWDEGFGHQELRLLALVRTHHIMLLLPNLSH